MKMSPQQKIVTFQAGVNKCLRCTRDVEKELILNEKFQHFLEIHQSRFIFPYDINTLPKKYCLDILYIDSHRTVEKVHVFKYGIEVSIVLGYRSLREFPS